jgi:hypothetical protein
VGDPQFEVICAGPRLGSAFAAALLFDGAKADLSAIYF